MDILHLKCAPLSAWFLISSVQFPFCSLLFLAPPLQYWEEKKRKVQKRLTGKTSKIKIISMLYRTLILSTCRVVCVNVLCMMGDLISQKQYHTHKHSWGKRKQEKKLSYFTISFENMAIVTIKMQTTYAPKYLYDLYVYDGSWLFKNIRL